MAADRLDSSVLPSDLASVLDQLRRAGLDPSEADAYAHLSLHGATRAAALASNLHWPRSKAYRVLEAMQARGIVLASVDRPIAFRPVDPTVLFRHLEDLHKESLAQVERAREAIVPVLGEWHDRLGGASTGGTSFAVVKGTAAVRRAVLDRIEGSPARIRAHLPVQHVATLPGGPEILEALSKASREGVDVRLIGLSSGPGELDAMVSIRQIPRAEAAPFIVFDEGYLVAAVPPPDATPRTSQQFMCTDAAGLVENHVRLFEHLWDARPAGP